MTERTAYIRPDEAAGSPRDRALQEATLRAQRAEAELSSLKHPRAIPVDGDSSSERSTAAEAEAGLRKSLP